MSIKFRDLTPEQIEEITNGCGGKGGPFNPPDWIFTASCNHHDFNYWVGNTEAGRLKADYQFYEAMWSDAQEKGKFWNRWWYKLMAWTYYRAVRRFGKPYYNYGEKRTSLDANKTD